MVNQQDRLGQVERRLNSFQDTLQSFKTLVDLVPRLQEEVASMGVRLSEVQGEVAAMGAKVDGIQGTINRLEELMIRQARNQRSPPRRPREDYSPPGGIWNDQTSPGQEPGRPARVDPSPLRRDQARGRDGYHRYRFLDRSCVQVEQQGKNELPLFHGEDPHRWIFRAKRYFAINDIEEGEKVMVASVCMEGRVLS